MVDKNKTTITFSYQLTLIETFDIKVVEPSSNKPIPICKTSKLSRFLAVNDEFIGL